MMFDDVSYGFIIILRMLIEWCKLRIHLSNLLCWSRPSKVQQLSLNHIGVMERVELLKQKSDEFCAAFWCLYHLISAY